MKKLSASASSPLLTESGVIDAIVNTDRYPIHMGSDSRYGELVEKSRADLKRAGYSLLDNFIRDDVIKTMSSESADISHLGYHNLLTGNAYLTPVDETLPEEDPRRLTDTTALSAVANDLIPANHAVKRLYRSDLFLGFIADCLGYPVLYRYSDPLSALNLAVMKEGDHLRWHFDQSDFVVSLMIDTCHDGGLYEVVPGIRSRSDENLEAVDKILRGSTDGVLTLDIQPGCLVLFQGKYSIHRVTKVVGSKDRVIALFSFDTKPDTVSSDYLKEIRYGRLN